MDFIGHVVHFQGERDGGAYVPAFAGAWIQVAQAMMEARPGATICVEPVTEIPLWVLV